MPETTKLKYIRQFDPPMEPPADSAVGVAEAVGDRRDGRAYVYTEEIILAVNVALATRRPLLITGPSGSGKSSLAKSIANTLRRDYYEVVVTSRLQAQDLLWTFDAVRRLGDAQANQLQPNRADYIEPGKLWWAFDKESAARHGRPAGTRNDPVDPAQREETSGSVVLIDEIDKADPDLPNGLLVPLGSFQFDVPEINLTVRTTQAQLIIITTNEERELSKAFLRRCIALKLPPVTYDRIIKIGLAHFGKGREELCTAVAGLFYPKTDKANDTPGLLDEFMSAKPHVSAAEYVDAVWACIELGITHPKAGNPVWDAVRQTICDRAATSGSES